MKISAHHGYAKLQERFRKKRNLLRPWSGFAYRVTTLDYPRPESILQGEGSFLHGGRWNAIGSFRAVYGSTTDTVAVAESRANAEYAGIRFPIRAPRLLVTIELQLEAVLDLTQAVVIEQLELRMEELREEDWRKIQATGFESFSQCLGRAAFAVGATGLVAPSAKVHGGVNVVYFPEQRRASERAQVCEPGKLDRIQIVGHK
jgi:RES domain-containing protein